MNEDIIIHEVPLQAVTSPWGRRRPVDSPFDKTLPSTASIPPLHHWEPAWRPGEDPA